MQGHDAGRSNRISGLYRVLAASPKLRVADCDFNESAIIDQARNAASLAVDLVVFPELCITAYSCADLFYQTPLLKAAERSLLRIAEATKGLGIAVVAGLPLVQSGKLFNCAAMCADGRVAGIVPKTVIPNSNEYYEARWFSSGDVAHAPSVKLGGVDIPFGTDLLFSVPGSNGAVIGIEICEDLWAPASPGASLALAGATVIVNLSASNALVGKSSLRRALVQTSSLKYLCAYAYASAGAGESTTDTVFAGHTLICENGVLLAESDAILSKESEFTFADIDVERISALRLRSPAYSRAHVKPLRLLELPELGTAACRKGIVRSDLTRTPFVPTEEFARSTACREAFSIQRAGIAKRIMHMAHASLTAAGCSRDIRAVIALSGGLDSTLALLVTAAAFDDLKLPRSGIVGITMPGPGTTRRSLGNVEKLAASLGFTLRTIPIQASVDSHLQAIGHDSTTPDATYQNSYARERTKIAMDVASMVGGLNIGSSDMSELALGYCTYNGDQMSMYHVNSGVPKTLVRAIVEWVAKEHFTEAAGALMDVCAMPSSPELAPSIEDRAPQVTEEIVGPDILQDFFLYYVVKYGFDPAKLFQLARAAFDGDFDDRTLRRWMTVFYVRFFASQFKRSAIPDGPKVCEIALSPRADLRMPSDALGGVWLQELRALTPADASP